MLKIEFSNLAKVLLWEEAPEAFSSGALRMCTGKEKIGSAERWMDIVVKLDTKAVSLENTQLHVKVKGMDSEKVLSEIKTPAVTPDALVRLDMRGLNKEHANLHVEWRASDGKILGIGEIWVSAEPATPLARGTRIPVKLDLPKGTEKIEKYPVRFGLPLPRGALWEAKGLKVVDPAGREIPSQLETAGRWAEEGSVKWLWVDAIVSAKTGDTIYVESGIRSTLSLPVMPVKVEEKGNMLLVNTGVAEYTVGRDGGLIKEVRCANRIIAREGNLRGLYVVDQKGRVGKASATGSSMEIESDGPVSAVVKIEGFYKTEQGEELARHITRLKFGAGRQEAEVTHTLILTRNTNEVWFRDIGWEFDVSAGADAKALFSIIPGDFRSPADGKISMKGTWGVETAKAEEVPVKEKNISIPLSGQKICSVVQKEGISLGLKPFNIPLWNHATKPATGWAPYLHGKPLLEVKEEGKEGVVYEGENMGDWFAVEGRNGGLMISCRDAAAQHPKEFEVSGNRLNFKLFSSASGKELDFRMESLMKNWGMLPLEKVDSYDKVPRKLLEGYLGFISKHESNAIGWAKTHEMLFAPSSSSVLPVWSLLHSRQVFAHVSPSWIRETRAMGTMHPKDIQNFPHDETLIENLFWGKVKQGDGGPVGGFVDYNAGPHWIIHSWRSGSYTIRSDSWYLYARSADRSIREFAEGANRAFLDNNMAHWNSPGKIPGLLLGGSSGPGDRGDRTRKCDLPMYWETTADSYEQATVANYDQALLDYYITGSRRSGDIMASFARAIKENLTTSVKHWRVILAVRHISQAYEFSWDPKIKELIYEIIDRSIYDPESPVLLTKARPHRSSTYKMETDGDVLVELYELFGDRLFHKMAMAIAQYNWDKEAINPPKSPSQNRSSGMLGYFLWEQTKNPSVAARFEYGKRRLVGDRLSDPENGGLKLTCVSQIPRYFKGLPYAMDIIKRTEADKDKSSSWLAFSTESPSTKIFLTKPGEVKFLGHYAPQSQGETSMEILVKKEESASVEHFKGREENGVKKPWAVGNSVVLKPHTVLRYIWMGHDLHSVNDNSFGVTKITLPKDSPGGIYELEITAKGDYSVFTDKHAPLVLLAPDGWRPPKMNPPVRIYFNVPAQGEKGRIFFEKETKLFTPEGKPYREEEQLFGWVEMPQDKPGLWSFESAESGKVKTENLPGFFAMNNPDFYMEYK